MTCHVTVGQLIEYNMHSAMLSIIMHPYFPLRVIVSKQYKPAYQVKNVRKVRLYS